MEINSSYIYIYIYIYMCICVYMWPWSTKPVLSRWSIFVAIAKNTLYGSKLSILFLSISFILIIIYYLLSFAPPYHSDLLQSYSPSRSLWSADQKLLTVSRVKRKLWRDRAFSVIAPRLWNSLPLNIRTASTLGSIKSLFFGFFVAFYLVIFLSCNVVWLDVFMRSSFSLFKSCTAH